MRDTYIFEYLDTAGNGTGSSDLIGDYSVTEEEFYYTAIQKCEIHRMLVGVRDTGSFDAEDYGNGVGLTNGIEVFVDDFSQSSEIDLLGGKPIKSNAEWGFACFDVDVKNWGAGDEFMLVRWTFSKSGQPLKLDAGDRFVVRVNDDFSGINDHRYFIQGILK